MKCKISLSYWVVKVDPFVGLRLDELAIEKQFGSCYIPGLKLCTPMPDTSHTRHLHRWMSPVIKLINLNMKNWAEELQGDSLTFLLQAARRTTPAMIPRVYVTAFTVIMGH